MMRSGADTAPTVLYPAGPTRISPGEPGAAGVARALMPALIPASWLYHAVSSAIRCSRSEAAPPAVSGTTVISVGNLVAGGGGKTPLCLYLLRKIAAGGGAPMFLSRGYGSTGGRTGLVTVVPAQNDGTAGALAPGIRLVRRESPDLVSKIGDEGAMVVRRLPDIPAVFAADKNRAMEIAVGVWGPTHVVLDDAFQSWGVPRDVDILMLDANRPFANGWLLPAGPLREPPEAIARADYVGLNGARDRKTLDRVAGELYRITGEKPPVFGVKRTVRVAATLDDSPLAAVSGIARPGAFETGVSAAVDSPVRLSMRYPDHYPYTPADVENILREADGRGIRHIVTTEKDWAKLAELDPPLDRFVVARLVLELFGELPPLTA